MGIPQSLRTCRCSPSTFVTRTRLPWGIGFLGGRLPDLAVCGELAAALGDAGERLTACADHRRGAHDRGLPPRRQAEARQQGGDRREAEDDGQHHAQAQLQLGQRGIDEDHRSQDQAHEPADGEQAEARDLDLQHEQQQPEEEQQEPGVVHGQHREREEREQQAQSADDARQHRAWVPQLDREGQRAQAHEQVGDVRVRDGAQHALSQRSSRSRRPPRSPCAARWSCRRSA